MDKDLIVQTIVNLFNGADKHDWEIVKNSFCENVLLDYSSLSGQPASTLSSTDIITSWKSFLPKFMFTLHMLSNFEVGIQGNKATAFCKGQAVHHLPNAEGGDLWTVFGTYDFALDNHGGNWHVSSMKLNLLYQDGNKQLPVLAMAN
ncbi:nuclear transport factor 2 family protein [Chitinophagaceae bacterium 26-R-25]|nr:nuclear transport factor 2 family protein [Chitinophagaceae bacterium 26-R-25]